MSELVVYGKPDCPQCVASVRMLKVRGVAFRYVDVTVDDEAFELVRSWGYSSVPVVDWPGLDRWSGFRPDRLKRAAETVVLSAV